MNPIQQQYQMWCDELQQAVATNQESLQSTTLLEELRAENGDMDKINDRFYCDLAFGTGGLRGVLGAGTNRMNIYTVAKATRGLASYLTENTKMPSCAIAYDSRNNSEVFAKIAAATLAQAGVTVHLYDQLMPTPMLSYAVRELGCDSGVVITASHNPAKYNGYKVYGADGCQITLQAAEEISRYIQKQPEFVALPSFEVQKQAGKIQSISATLIEGYYEKVQGLCINPPKEPLHIVYSPLNGAGNVPVRTILSRFDNVTVSVVKEQELPDGNFPTCSYPNPEEPAAMALAIALAKEQQADFCLATDPDCDRVGVAVLQNGTPRLIDGNEMGVMLLRYLCEVRLEKMPENAIAIKTIVTTELARKVAESYGVQVVDVLTGFKFIGEQVGLLEQKGEENRFLLGFEESYGYLAGDFVRDKDAVIATMLICEMAAYYKAQGKNLIDVITEIYETYGYNQSKLLSFEFAGAQGMEVMKGILNQIRTDSSPVLFGKTVCNRIDYQFDDTGLPKSNVIKLLLQDDTVLVIRPSGTEPKLKIYLTASAKDLEGAQTEVESLTTAVTAFIENISLAK